MNVYLFGSHSNRTPFSYAAYKVHLNSVGFNVVDKVDQSDFVVLGFKQDILSNFSVLSKINKDIKIVVLSEEPLWDTLWSSGFENKKHTVTLNNESIEYYNINHFTSDLFEYITIPYFVTTDNSYFVKYSSMFKRNAYYSSLDILEIWNSSKYKFASISEYRNDSKYDRAFLDKDYSTLSCFRTDISQMYREYDNSLVLGKGWDNQTKRQDIIDWHLDKLEIVDKKCLFMSSIENTYCNNYITEKLFDAYASMAIPVYYMPRKSNKQLFSRCLSLRAASKNPEDLGRRIADFEVGLDVAHKYHDTQEYLCEIFSDFEIMNKERHHLSLRLRSLFSDIRNNDFNGMKSKKLELDCLFDFAA